MKRRIILTISIVALIVSVGLANYAKPSKKIAVAQSSLSREKIDSVEGYQEFKGKADVKISENRRNIAALKAKAPSDDKAENEKYLKILALEQKNNELEIRINDASDTRTNMWLIFMREFNRDMTSLERGIKGMGV